MLNFFKHHTPITNFCGPFCFLCKYQLASRSVGPWHSAEKHLFKFYSALVQLFNLIDIYRLFFFHKLYNNEPHPHHPVLSLPPL